MIVAAILLILIITGIFMTLFRDLPFHEVVPGITI